MAASPDPFLSCLPVYTSFDLGSGKEKAEEIFYAFNLLSFEYSVFFR